MGLNILSMLNEPEIQSSLFLTINVLGSFIFTLIYGTWPLTWCSTLFYLGLALFINHFIASGSSYYARKNLTGQTVIVTGAATGIGRVTAIQLAKVGARVIVGVRGQSRAERIAAELVDESNGGLVVGHDLDLSVLENVKNFANKIDRVDILINNAGGLQDTYQVTPDGFERQFATNYLGHFYLTELLLPKLSENGRVVNVSSLVHHICKRSSLDYSFAALRKKYNTFEAYGISKLAQVYHASELVRRHSIKAYSLHPGTIVNTNLNQNRSQIQQNILKLFSLLAKNVEQGAMTTLFCALSDEAQPGHYHSDCQVRQPSSLALDQQLAAQCYDESQRLINKKNKDQ